MFKCLNKSNKKEKPWYDLAKSEIGVKEISGSGNNSRIIEYHQATTLKATQDSVAWCSSFVCWCLESSGIKSTRSAAARSFLNWGKSVSRSAAEIGDIVIFKRGNSSWQGHVAFLVKDLGTYIEVLGGNQSDSVSIDRYRSTDLLGIRRP